MEGFATTAQSDNHYVYLPEPDTDQKGVAINNEVSDVLDIPVASTPPPLPEQEAPKVRDFYLSGMYGLNSMEALKVF